MIINKSLLSDMQRVVDEKARIWKEYFPKLEFDKHGRALLSSVPDLDESTFRPMLRCSASFERAFNEYLNQKFYRIRYNSGDYSNLFFANYVSFYDYVENYYHFQKCEGGNLVRVKASKVLAAVQDIWVKYNPEYSTLTKTIKELREQGATYESSEELKHLISQKGYLEEGNLYILYQKIMNEYNGSTTGIYLSVNPLDLLTSSGDRGENPTNFSSCWSTSFEDCYGELDVCRAACYSTPEDIVALGEIENRGILYIPNGRTFEIPDTDFSFLGYRERTHCWFDIRPNGILLEKVYPGGGSFDKYKDALSTKNIDVLEYSSDYEGDYKLFNYNDDLNLRRFEEEDWGRSVFLDRVAISGGQLYYLPMLRTDYDDYGDSIWGLIDEGERCEDCGRNCSDSTYISGYGYVCNSCYENYVSCDDCGEIHYYDNLYTAYNYYGERISVCESCLDNYIQCEDCGDYHSNDTVTETSNGYVCEGCLENYSYCSECDTYHTGESFTTDDGYVVCEDCMELYFITCSECGSITKDYEFVDGKYYCDDCVPVDCAV